MLDSDILLSFGKFDESQPASWFKSLDSVFADIGFPDAALNDIPFDRLTFKIQTVISRIQHLCFDNDLVAEYGTALDPKQFLLLMRRKTADGAFDAYRNKMDLMSEVVHARYDGSVSVDQFITKVKSKMQRIASMDDQRSTVWFEEAWVTRLLYHNLDGHYKALKDIYRVDHADEELTFETFKNDIELFNKAAHRVNDVAAKTEMFDPIYTAAYKQESAKFIAAGAWDARKPIKITKSTAKKLVDIKPEFSLKDGRLWQAKFVAHAKTPAPKQPKLHAPTLKHDELMVMLNTALGESYKIAVLKIEDRYLNTPLQEELYVKLPAQFSGNTDKCYRLQKAIYGLRQSSANWYAYLNEYLTSCGFKQCPEANCVYRDDLNPDLQLGVYVDMIFVFYNDEEMLSSFYKMLSGSFEVTTVHDGALDMRGVARYILLGLNVEYKLEDYIKIDCCEQIDKLCKLFLSPRDIEIADVILTPNGAPWQALETWMQTKRFEEHEDNKLIQQVVGHLNYISQMYRFDITYYTNVLSKLGKDQPLESIKLKALKRVVKYLYNTRDEKLTLKWEPRMRTSEFDHCKFSCYSATSFGEQKLNRIAYVAQINGNPFACSSTIDSKTRNNLKEAELGALEPALEMLNKGIKLSEFLAKGVEVTDLHTEIGNCTKNLRSPKFDKIKEALDTAEYLGLDEDPYGGYRELRVSVAENLARVLLSPDGWVHESVERIQGNAK